MTIGNFTIEQISDGHIIVTHNDRDIHIQASESNRYVYVDIYGSGNASESSDVGVFYNGTHDKEATK